MDLPDVNLLLYAFDVGADRHKEYADWLNNLVAAPNPFGVTDWVLAGFVRICTNPKIYKAPATTDEAFNFLDTILGRSNCIRFSPEAKHWQIFRRLCDAASAKGNLITDAYLAALAIEHDLRLITTDSDFAKFRGLRWKHPLVL